MSRSPATPGPGCSGCPPTARWSTGWASTTTAPRRSRRGLRSGPSEGPPRRRARARRQHRQDQGRARGRRGGRARRLHQVRPAARPARRLPRRQRQLAEHPGPAQPPGRRPAGAAPGRRTPRGRRTPAGQDRPRPRRRRRRRRGRPGPADGARRDHRHQHHDLPRRVCARLPPRSRRSEPVASPARRSPRGRWRCCACSRRPSATRLALVSVGGISTAERRQANASTPGPRSCRPTRASSTAARCGRGRWSPGSQMSGPVHVTGEVIASRRAGAYRDPDAWSPRAWPSGSGPAPSSRSRSARRCWAGARCGCTGSRQSGGYGATLDLVVSPAGPGTRWLAALPVGSRVAVTGPLGRPFALPTEAARCLLVGEGYAAAPLFPLAERLRERGCAVTPRHRRRRRGPPAQRARGAAVRRQRHRGDRRRQHR